MVLRGVRRRSLLALLALSGRASASAADIVERLTGRPADTASLAALYALISRLRVDLGTAASVIVRSPAGYRLDPDLVVVDATTFESELDAARCSTAPADELRHLDAARSLAGRAVSRTARRRRRPRPAPGSSGSVGGPCNGGGVSCWFGSVGRTSSWRRSARLRAEDAHDDELVGLHCRALYVLRPSAGGVGRVAPLHRGAGRGDRPDAGRTTRRPGTTPSGP